MTLASYAQNFEDVILWRALKNIKRGFYIDIGAQDPLIDSVSLAFYDQGWRGVHVEPVRGYAQKLRAARPDEQVMEVAIGRCHETVRLFEFPDTGLSTASETIAQLHMAKGYPMRPVDVACIPLSQLLDEHKSRPIHWLKIDVEGMERDVIESWLPSTVRPWIVVIESTQPKSQETSHGDWEPALLALGYQFVYFDGLNRFYVSQDQPQLKATFGPGPNWFDDFALSKHSYFARAALREIASENERLQARALSLANELSLKNEAIVAIEMRAKKFESALTNLRASTSWRITAPLRALSSVWRSLMGSTTRKDDLV